MSIGLPFPQVSFSGLFLLGDGTVLAVLVGQAARSGVASFTDKKHLRQKSG